MRKGQNLAEQSRVFSSTSFSGVTIFLSHISIDKDVAIKIGQYIMDAGFDIYLDINDQKLQQAVKENNAAVITQCIEQGISKSTHIMCLISEKTKESWWVPYELGFGKKSGKIISSLCHRDVTYIPPYLRIATVLEGIESLNKYLESLIKKQPIVLNEQVYKQYSWQQGYLVQPSTSHPLVQYLKAGK